MAQHTGRLFDADLTLSADEYSAFSTEFVDLFEPLGDDDAPIAKLKTIILSIDWEITDDILHQLNDELQDLKDVWAGNKINLVYIQALEKIGRYICTEKVHAHPNAIKLLLAFYYDLEKIVSSTSMSEETKKQLLLQDVKKFEQFKQQIAPAVTQGNKSVPVMPHSKTNNILTPLKAILLEIYWEISDKYLGYLDEEVARLEIEFADSRVKLIFLQGISALGGYIRSTKGTLHPDALKLLHSFFEGLNKICVEDLSSAKEKEILLAEVNKFNYFKAVIAPVPSEEVFSSDDGVPSEDEVVVVSAEEVPVESDDEEENDYEAGGVVVPAFTELSEDVRGFDVRGLDADAKVVESDVDQRVASFFGEDEVAIEPVATEAAVLPEKMQVAADVTTRLDVLFGDDKDVEQLGQEEVTSDIAMAGVDVEKVADDESGEPPLPREQGWIAPALMFSEEGDGVQQTESPQGMKKDNADLEDRLDSFFSEEIEEVVQGVTTLTDGGDETLSPGRAVASSFQASDVEPASLTPLKIEEFSGVETQGKVGGGSLPEVQMGPSGVSAFLVQETGDEELTETGAEDLEVFFEAVGDDVAVDELPVFPGISGGYGLSVVEQELLVRLWECLASMLERKYYTGLPSLIEKASMLILVLQTQYVKKSFLQLLVTVCQYIDRVGADTETLALLQSIGKSLELLFLGKIPTEREKEQLVFAGMVRVLGWQQGLILSVLNTIGSSETD